MDSVLVVSIIFFNVSANLFSIFFKNTSKVSFSSHFGMLALITMISPLLDSPYLYLIGDAYDAFPEGFG